MNKKIITILASYFFSAQLSFGVDAPKTESKDPKSAQLFVDYRTVAHTLSLESFRSGHTTGKTTHYYFLLRLTALIDSQEERAKELKDRKNIVKEFDPFWNITLNSLTPWEPDKILKSQFIFEVSKDEIVALITKMMEEQKILEKDVSIKGTLEIYTKTKDYIVYSEKAMIRQEDYWPIPSKTSTSKISENTLLDFAEPNDSLAGSVQVNFHTTAVPLKAN